MTTPNKPQKNAQETMQKPKIEIPEEYRGTISERYLTAPSPPLIPKCCYAKKQHCCYCFHCRYYAMCYYCIASIVVIALLSRLLWICVSMQSLFSML